MKRGIRFKIEARSKRLKGSCVRLWCVKGISRIHKLRILRTEMLKNDFLFKFDVNLLSNFPFFAKMICPFTQNLCKSMKEVHEK